MLTKFHLVEKHNTVVVLYKKLREDKFVGIRKEFYPPKDCGVLHFPSYDSAEKWLVAHNLDDLYQPEEIAISEFLCPVCGEHMDIHWVEGADRTQSGMTERVCTCRNDYCNLDWRTYHTADGEFVKIERFFCG